MSNPASKVASKRFPPGTRIIVEWLRSFVNFTGKKRHKGREQV
jgi:hypothetical protein